ncbi:hypothetical protein EQG63_08395 [Flavobacterium amnicola]|uniref:YdhG-like domain-containing protein n=1 Tax=Flavobacterium amnicola TaxID=2506422 RepID=A0A4Q1K2S9_9FLAO|nr:DUF1801 domain-containing protein [Flavobacterium amnicola]RXR18279.1 hypothetical protein EQG63_08395 [Flavobacterium amnicola]
MERSTPKNVDDYISWFPEETQKLLVEIRNLIKKYAPEAEETISYNIPAYKLHGILLYFAGYQKHVSIYPAPRENAIFKEELQNYKGGKGTLQFPLNKPLPHDLIQRIIVFRKEKNATSLNHSKKTKSNHKNP